MFAMMHAAGLIHNVQTPDDDFWLTAEEVLRCATLGGARSACLESETGSLEVGKKADMIVHDLSTVAFTPRNDVANHLVYCEAGASITHAIVNGEIMAEGGRCLRVDEAALLAELREAMPAFLAAHEQTEALNRQFDQYFRAIHRRCNGEDVGVTRLGNEPAWRS
jgi:cytosine/adenosine deaminase-related metal-dependent hydrolase